MTDGRDIKPREPHEHIPARGAGGARENGRESDPPRDTIRDEIRRLEREHRALGSQIQELKKQAGL